ncbi:MAG: RNA 2'-phosphotransferase [Pyrinomonadaceae bacterium]
MMSEKQKTKLSKFLSLVLRHRPEAVGLTLEENGWVGVEALLEALAENGRPTTRQELVEVVETNDKKRFSFDDDQTKIRANQGHSLGIELEFEEKPPPKILYHGTAEKNLRMIEKTGLKKMKRHHVHLSADEETARRVGIRYGRPVIFRIDTEKMLREGHRFFVSANGVWLTDEVPPRFLELQ